MLKLVFTLSCLFLSSVYAASDAATLLKKFDTGYYHPQEKGLKDLVVRVDVSNITKQLNEQLIFGKLKEVYFKLYWSLPNNVEVEVIGLPEGFAEIKSELRGMIASRLDMLVPQDLESKFAGYEMKTKTNGLLEEILATDTTQTKLIHEFTAGFDKDGNIVTLVGRKPMALEESTMKYLKLPWSQGKWLVTEIKVKMSEPGQVTTANTGIEYTTMEGFGFPKKLKTVTKQSLQGADKKTIERVVTSEITFSDFKINTSEAQTYIKKAKAAANP